MLKALISIIVIIVVAGLGYLVYQEISAPSEIIPETAGTEAKNCEVDSDCVIFGGNGDCNCGCFNKNYLGWKSGGACFCAVPKSCQCISGKCEGIFGIVEENKDEACLSSGGQIITSLCCELASDYPNLCLIGACGCSPDNSHEVKICECGEGRCFDGERCADISLE